MEQEEKIEVDRDQLVDALATIAEIDTSSSKEDILDQAKSAESKIRDIVAKSDKVDVGEGNEKNEEPGCEGLSP